MGGSKRRKAPSTDISRKFPKTSPETSRVFNEEEDLESILAEIRQQEQNEALGKSLQQESTTSKDSEVIDLTESPRYATNGAGPSTIEDDEVMARRLAREWAESDVAESSMKHSGKVLSGSSLSAFASVDVINPEDDLLQYRDLFTQSRSCTKCGNVVASPRNLVAFTAEIPPPALLALLHAVCDACGQSHCRGCFRVLDCPRSCKGKLCNVSKCCAEIRAIGLFEALGGHVSLKQKLFAAIDGAIFYRFDRQYLGEQMNCSTGSSKPPTSQPKIDTVGPGGTGYSAETRSVSFGKRNSRHAQTEDQKAAKNSKAVAARWDDVVLRALDTMTYLLPSPYADAAAVYDLLPHSSIRSLISISYLPELLGGLLINDSVTDWADRSGVYNSMLRLLRRMADSELSIGVLISERLEKKKSVGLEDWMWGDGVIDWERKPGTDEIVRTPPLYDHFKKLTKQCETFLAGVSHLLEGGGAVEIEEMTVKATSLCGDMISAQQDIRRALSVIMRDEPPVNESNSKGKGKTADHRVDVEQRYRISCEELGFKHVTLSCESAVVGLLYPNYYYANDVTHTATASRQPAKRLHLIKEISALSTSLPPGVWVRVDEIRNDVMKMMIAGPEGTPYAGGLFEFDCFMPLDYPTTSPKMSLSTTAGGAVRFNPNLYASGQVCLSLLGTWPGRPEEQWSSKSTLLQVLVSIQSMILVDAPFFNEPGFGKANLQDKRSILYNRHIALQTVRWAMVEWMQEEHRKGIWADVIASHFSIRKKSIRECVHAWAQEDARFRKYEIASAATAGKMNPASTEPDPRASSRSRKQKDIGVFTRDLLADLDQGWALIDTWT